MARPTATALLMSLALLVAILSPAVNARRLVDYSNTAVATATADFGSIVDLGEEYGFIELTPTETCICVVLDDCECDN